MEFWILETIDNAILLNLLLHLTLTLFNRDVANQTATLAMQPSGSHRCSSPDRLTVSLSMGLPGDRFKAPRHSEVFRQSGDTGKGSWKSRQEEGDSSPA